MKKQKAYICSPLSAGTPEGIRENMRRANQYAKEISRLLGCRAVAVHGVLPELLDDDDPDERKLALDFGKKYLATCTMLVICGGQVTSGMIGEINEAVRLNIPIFLYSEGKLCSLSPPDLTRDSIHGFPGQSDPRRQTASITVYLCRNVLCRTDDVMERMGYGEL